MLRIAAYQQLDVLPLKVAYLLWGPGIGFSLHYHLKKKKRERDNELYFGGGGDCTPLLGMPFKNDYRKKLKRKLMLVYTAMLGNEHVFLLHWELLDRLMKSLLLCYWTQKLCLISYSIVRLQLQH